MNVLIVEDNKPVSMTLCRLVEEAGHGYVIAADGDTALKMFAQRDIDMAIIDVELPGLDGYQVARSIRNANARLPLVIISGNSGESWQQQARDAGADLFISKPIRPSEMNELLARFLSSATPTPPPSTAR